MLNDERSAYDYLPGGHVMVYENTDEAIKRGLREELYVDLKMVRPLWLNQRFFIEDVSKKSIMRYAFIICLMPQIQNYLSEGKSLKFMRANTNLISNG